MLKKILTLPVRVVLTVLFVAVIVWQLGGVEEIWHEITDVDAPRYLLLFMAIVTIDRALMTYKWILLLRSRGQQLPFFRALVIYGASTVWGMFLPSTMGADAVRIYQTSRAGLSTEEVVASIAMERILGFLSALLVGLCCFILLSRGGYLDARFNVLWWLGGLMILAAILAFAASFSRRVYDWLYDRALVRFRNNHILLRLGHFHNTYLSYRNNRRTLISFFVLTLFEQLMPILDVWSVTLALGVNTDILTIALVIPLALLVTRVPVSIDGIGVFEGIFAALMALGGVPPAQSIAISLVGRVALVVALLPWWLLHMLGVGQPVTIPPAAGGSKRSLTA